MKRNALSRHPTGKARAREWDEDESEEGRHTVVRSNKVDGVKYEEGSDEDFLPDER